MTPEVYLISTTEYADNSLQAGTQGHHLMSQIKSKIERRIFRKFDQLH